MKKRKIKLFASIASLALVVAVMGTGIWAATQQAAKVTSTVKFAATNILGNVSLQVADSASDSGANDILKTAKTANSTNDGVATSGAVDYTSMQQILNITAESTNPESNSYNSTTNIYIELQDADNDGFIKSAATITYTFKIVNTSTTNAMYAKITTPAETSQFAVSAGYATTKDAAPGSYATIDSSFVEMTIAAASGDDALDTGWFQVTFTVQTYTNYETLPTGDALTALKAKPGLSGITDLQSYKDAVAGFNYSLANGGFYTLSNISLGDTAINLSNKVTAQ